MTTDTSSTRDGQDTTDKTPQDAAQAAETTETAEATTSQESAEALPAAEQDGSAQPDSDDAAASAQPDDAAAETDETQEAPESAAPAASRAYELLGGKQHELATPTVAHQAAVGRLVAHMAAAVDFAGLGRVLPGPCFVELAPDTILQPDVLVVLNDNAEIITPERIHGAPDMVIEVAAPETLGYDRSDKFKAYARAGVREYWLADLAERSIKVWALETPTPAAAAQKSGGFFAAIGNFFKRLMNLDVPAAAATAAGAPAFQSLGAFQGQATLRSRLLPDIKVNAQQCFL
jgi:Uma2 family endonuclease